MSKRIITDTGFWIGYFDQRDQYHKEALIIADIIFSHTIICPFPSLYEFLNTRFTRNNKRIDDLELLLNKLSVIYVYDYDYRFDVISDFISRNKKLNKISLVDLVINRIIEDDNMNINCMVTFNKSDFSANCMKRNIEIIP